MRRPMCWTERLEEGVKRDVRVTFEGRGEIRWQSKRSDQESWDYDTPPSVADWASLLARAEDWYRRRRLPLNHLETVRRRAAQARANGEGAP